MSYESELAQIGEQYRAEGYDVFLRPQASQIPAFAAGFGVDILAARGEQKVLVQVKETMADLENDTTTARIAEVTERQPGWRFDLVVLHRNPDDEKMANEAAEPPVEHLLKSLDSAERAARTGDFASSFLIAWSSFEAAMRRAARDAGIRVGRYSPEFLLQSLYSNGLLERDEFDKLEKNLVIRNAVVHGLEVPNVDAALPLQVAGAARKLLALNGHEQPV